MILHLCDYKWWWCAIVVIIVVVIFLVAIAIAFVMSSASNTMMFIIVPVAVLISQVKISIIDRFVASTNCWKSFWVLFELKLIFFFSHVDGDGACIYGAVIIVLITDIWVCVCIYNQYIFVASFFDQQRQPINTWWVL